MFSIITPTYNRAHILSRAIDSVLKQTFQNWELIIVDDGSNDYTKDIILKYKDKRIRYFYQENKGVCSARNLGALNAKGEYITFLDSDDYVEIDWLYNFDQEIIKADYDFVFCDMRISNLDNCINKNISAQDPYSQNIISNEGLFMAGTFCVKLLIFKLVNGFDENIKFGEFTEFYFKTIKLNTTKSFTKKLGIIYESSHSGGSKNYENKISANLYLIQKHSIFFKRKSNVLRLYYQNIGIAYYHIKNFKKSRFYLWKAWIIKPFKLKTLIRFLLTYFPKIAKKLIK